MRHALNNLLGKIIGAAELALDYPAAPGAQRELQTVLRLAEEGAALIAGRGRPGPE